jgi:transcriptional regulator with XRE-family HTH domain
MKRELKKSVKPAEQKALDALGTSLKAARLARRMTIAELATRTGISVGTIKRLQQGDPAVALGSWFACLSVLGLLANVTVNLPKDQLGDKLRTQQIRQRGARKLHAKKAQLYDF